MSKWAECEMEDVSCSLDILRRALISIKPEWEKYLLTDYGGNIPLYKYHGSKGEKMADQGFCLVIPGDSHPDAQYPSDRYNHNDWGFYLKSGDSKKGVWGMFGADYGHKDAQKLANNIKDGIKANVAKMRIEQRNKDHGFKLWSRQKQGDEEIIMVLVPEDSDKLTV